MFNEIYMLVVVRTHLGLVICMFIDTNFRKKDFACQKCMHVQVHTASQNFCYKTVFVIKLIMKQLSLKRVFNDLRRNHDKYHLIRWESRFESRYPTAFLDKKRSWEDWISIKKCNKSCFHMLFSSITWNNIKTFISGNDMLGFLALPGALVGGIRHFLDQTATKTLGFLATRKLDPGSKRKPRLLHAKLWSVPN